MYNLWGQAVIRLGDTTSHGGIVVAATSRYSVYNIAAAQEGDLTVCPRCKGEFAILATPDSALDNGKTVAFEGTQTACGATLISSLKPALANPGNAAK